MGLCEGTAYLVNGEEKRLMEEVVSIHFKDGRVVLVDERGEIKVLNGVKELKVNMVTHEVWLST